jgi:hypothetical protein
MCPYNALRSQIADHLRDARADYSAARVGSSASDQFCAWARESEYTARALRAAPPHLIMSERSTGFFRIVSRDDIAERDDYAVTFRTLADQIGTAR